MQTGLWFQGTGYLNIEKVLDRNGKDTNRQVVLGEAYRCQQRVALVSGRVGSGVRHLFLRL